jgi:hypothetical protein
LSKPGVEIGCGKASTPPLDSNSSGSTTTISLHEPSATPHGAIGSESALLPGGADVCAVGLPERRIVDRARGRERADRDLGVELAPTAVGDVLKEECPPLELH